ncbi:MAG: HAD family hydrolase [Aigarchaeota archaeon]|nr:HAD family hydrolase [Aigarchaeota archaeon]
MLIKAVVFDLDGTLLVHKLRLREAKEKFLEKLEELGLKGSWISTDMPLAHILSGLDEKDRALAFNILDNVFEQFETKAVEEAELREDVREVLTFLKKLKIKMAIATNNGRKSVESILRKMLLEEFFDVVVTRNDVQDLKPNGKMLLETVKKLGVNIEEVIHIGDTTYDVLAAHENGIKCIAITGGAHSRELLLSSNPEFIVDSFKEIPAIIMNLQK